MASSQACSSAETSARRLAGAGTVVVGAPRRVHHLAGARGIAACEVHRIRPSRVRVGLRLDDRLSSACARRGRCRHRRRGHRRHCRRRGHRRRRPYRRCIVVIVSVGLRTGRAAAVACRWRAVAPFPLALLRFGQAVIGLLHADPVPGLGIGWKLEARISQEPVGDELRGLLPALRARASPAACGVSARRPAPRVRSRS